MFDDFSYNSNTDPALNSNGWRLRNGGGGPGIAGASWSSNNISFQNRDGQRVMRLQASTNGSPSGTSQAEVWTSARKYDRGTYAARVFFTDTPLYGPDGDHIVETFFTITPLRWDYDPEYGELDFEYLANGGWGVPQQSFYVTSWETYRPEPWHALNQHNRMPGSWAGWRDLVVTLDNNYATYYIDGVQVGRHSNPNLPKSKQTVNFNLWFINDGFLSSSQPRAYEQLVDYVYHAKDQVLTPAQVKAQVNSLRGANVSFIDTVPAN